VNFNILLHNLIITGTNTLDDYGDAVSQNHLMLHLWVALDSNQTCSPSETCFFKSIYIGTGLHCCSTDSFFGKRCLIEFTALGAKLLSTIPGLFHLQFPLQTYFWTPQFLLLDYAVYHTAIHCNAGCCSCYNNSW